jgi:uncharacterized protein YdhG (YjbR/CyaY superfamily)
MAITIAQGSLLVSELLEVFEHVYWESPSVNVKNQCFNVVRMLQQEMTELTKVSVQDHHYEYEPIASPAKVFAQELDSIVSLLQDQVLRTTTHQQLNEVLHKAKEVYG